VTADQRRTGSYLKHARQPGDVAEGEGVGRKPRAEWGKHRGGEAEGRGNRVANPLEYAAAAVPLHFTKY